MTKKYLLIKKFPYFLVFVLIGALSVSCVGSREHPMLTELYKGETSEAAPFVEAYIEYVGPGEKYAGYKNFLVYLRARDEKNVEISYSPHMKFHHNQQVPDEKTREIANIKAGDMKIEKIQIVRGYLTRLSDLLEEADGEKEKVGEVKDSKTACLSPVRVRLIRQDGALIEKHGCRTPTGWTVKLSQLVSDIIAMGAAEEKPGVSAASKN